MRRLMMSLCLCTLSHAGFAEGAFKCQVSDRNIVSLGFDGTAHGGGGFTSFTGTLELEAGSALNLVSADLAQFWWDGSSLRLGISIPVSSIETVRLDISTRRRGSLGDYSGTYTLTTIRRRASGPINCLVR
jgi:hypothetical protein